MSENFIKHNLKIKKLEPIIYLLPVIIIYSIFMFWPIIQNLYLSTLSWNMVSSNKVFVGFKNYLQIFTDPEFPLLLRNTFIYVIIMMVFNFIIPYLIAYVLARLIKNAAHFYRSLLFFPSLLSLAVAAIVFMWLLTPLGGPIAELFKSIGIVPPNWFKSRGYVLVALSIITAWRCFGFNLIIFIGAILDVPDELIEAAKIEKASSWTIFWRIVRPLTSSAALYVFIITFVFGLQYVFTPIHMLTQGGPNQESTNLIYVVYQYGFKFFQSGKAAAVAIISLIIFLIVIVIQKRLEKSVFYAN